jgi:heme/copper-type cytochrome/quinol oxidase subunit 2
MFGISLTEVFVLMILFFIIFIPWLITLIDILKSEFTGNNKIIWLLSVILVPVIGMIIYFVIGRRQKSEMP